LTMLRRSRNTDSGVTSVAGNSQGIFLPMPGLNFLLLTVTSQ